MHPAEIETRLKAIGLMSDEDFPVIEALILYGALDQEVTDISTYTALVAEMHKALTQQIADHPWTESDPVNYWRLERLNAVIFYQFGYRGNYEHAGFKDPEKINFLDVLTMRGGIPVAMGALFYELAHAQGWTIAGLNFPGHFIMHLEHGSSRLIFDPFNNGRVLNAAGMRKLLKDSMGEKSELHHDYYNPVTARELVLRFCNNRKFRFLQVENYDAALETVKHQLWVAPNEALLYFDGGMIAARMELFAQAIDYLSVFVEKSDDIHTIGEARAMIQSLQRKLQ